MTSPQIWSTMSLLTLGKSIAVSGLVLAGLFGAAAPAAADQTQDRWVNIPDTATVAHVNGYEFRPGRSNSKTSNA